MKWEDYIIGFIVDDGKVNIINFYFEEFFYVVIVLRLKSRGEMVFNILVFLYASFD